MRLMLFLCLQYNIHFESMDQRVVLTFQFYYLKTVPYKAIDALEIPLLDLGKVN